MLHTLQANLCCMMYCPIYSYCSTISLTQWILALRSNRCTTDAHRASSSTLTDRTVVSLSENGFGFRFFSSMHQVPQCWDDLAPAEDLFLQRPYLTALEEAPPAKMGFGYLIFYRQQQPIGLAICQMVLFNVGETIRTSAPSRDNGLVNRVKTNVTSKLKQKLAFRLLISGSLLLTGEHGYYFDSQSIPADLSIRLLSEALEILRSGIDEPEHSSILVKDIEAADSIADRGWQKEKFHRVAFQPNMVLDLQPDWRTFDDYLAALQSKYRVRARRAFKKSADLVRRELTLEEILAVEDQLYELYLNVAQGADFNALFLHRSYLSALKQALGERFRLWTYLDQGRILGFCTAIHNGVELEAHFLGMETSANQQHQLYLRMLYDLLAAGIEDQTAEKVIYARTAMEIKSSIGAVAQDMYCYLKHKRSITNRLLPYFVNYLEPKVQWQARHPFK